MNKYTYLPTILWLAPFMAQAQAGSVQGFFANLLLFTNSTVIPFILGVGFLFVAINVVRYFIIGGSSEEGREKAKSLATYSIGAFVFLMVFWGIVNLLAQSIGLEECSAITPDYVMRNTDSTIPPHCLPAQTAAHMTDADLDNEAGVPGSADNLDLSVDDSTELDTSLTRDNSADNCTSFTVEGVCTETSNNLLSANPTQFNSWNELAGSDRYDLISRNESDDRINFVLRERGTNNQLSITMTETFNGNGIMIQMVQNENTPGVRWANISYVYNESRNVMDFTIISNSTRYAQSIHGTVTPNDTGGLTYSWSNVGSPVTTTSFSFSELWGTPNIPEELGRTTPTPEAVPPNAPTPDYTVR
jgi:Type IV secretion system pilin